MNDQEYRKYISMAYIRVCRDSGFKFDHFRAAQFTAQLISIHPIEILTAVGNLSTMEEIAKGIHPVVNNPDYDNRKKI